MAGSSVAAMACEARQWLRSRPPPSSCEIPRDGYDGSRQEEAVDKKLDAEPCSAALNSVLFLSMETDGVVSVLIS